MTLPILGAGVAGLVTAVELAERGVEVAVWEQAATPKHNRCSRFAGGMLAPWCEGESAEPEVVRLGISAIDWWQRHVPDCQQLGTLVLAPPRDMAELTRFARRSQEHVAQDGAQIAELEPDLAGRFQRGLFFQREAHLAPRKALLALRARLADLGVAIHDGCAPDVWQHHPGPVIDCRGLAAKDHLPDLRGVRGEMLLLRSTEIHLRRTIRLLHPRFPVYVVPHGDGIYMVGASMIESDSTGPISVRSTMELLGAATTLHPAFGEAEILEAGVGARPAFPNNIPQLRQIGARYYINGLYRHGYLLAPALARELAEQIAANPARPAKTYPEETHEDIRERPTTGTGANAA